MENSELTTKREGASESGATADGASASRGMFWGVSLCFVLSGVAGLLYQMVWMRYLSTVFGTSELAIVTVLVAYMGGLAVGSWIASKRVRFLKRPILVYAILEALIAASALLVPLLLKLVGMLHKAILGGQATPPSDGGVFEAIAYLGLGCLVLVIPTACMGATLPILARGVIRRTREIGGRIGWLYALNTFGAVGGTVLAAFFLIPSLGLWKTSFVGVGLNLLVACLGWFVALRAPATSDVEAEEGGSQEQAKPEVGSSRFRRIILVVMLVSGGISFAYEVLWSRLLSFYLGGSLYAFATMLAAFLAGIALGGLLGAALAVNRRRSILWLAGVEIGTGILTAFTFYYISSVPFVESTGGGGTLGSLASLCALVLMPSTLCLGATFPLAVRSLTEDHLDAGSSAGRVYAWNTIGAILGAVGAGYFLIPAIGYAGTFHWMITGNLVLGALLLATMTPRMRIPTVVAALLAIGSLVVYRPAPPLKLLAMSSLAAGESTKQIESRLIYRSVGRSATVTVIERYGAFSIRTNGLPEAQVFSKGAEALSYTGIRWLPALPKVLRPSADSMLVVGFGGGTLLEAVPSGYRSIDVLELEPDVISANEFIADRRAVDPFADERINVIINDARGALELTTKRYDTIVSQPSHPWTAGASHLYTREFLEIAREHMTEEGVYVQWLGASFVDEPLLRSFCATMLDVFPHVQLYLLQENFVFVGSTAPLDGNFLPGADEDGALRHLSEYSKLEYVEDVLAVLQLDEPGCQQLAGDHLPITDDRNLMATNHSLGESLSGAMNDPVNLKRVLSPIHYLNQDSPPLLRAPGKKVLHYDYLAKLLRTSARHIDLRRFNEETIPQADLLVMAAERTMLRDPGKAGELVQAAQKLHPEHTGARVLEMQIRLIEASRLRDTTGGGVPPKDLSEFAATNGSLQAAFDRLGPAHKNVFEADYWWRSQQGERVRGLEKELAAFDDHRDLVFMTAAQIRLASLLRTSGKSPDQQEQDARLAAKILDRLLALPLLSSVQLVSQRIALAQRFDDTAYQIAAGWILARKLHRAPASAPAQAKDVFRRPIAAILKPYSSRDSKDKIQISNEAIRQFYDDLIQEFGIGILPPGFGP